MLNDLKISNFAIIDELAISFGAGLNIISGETGAGKSIIIGAVSLLLGDRATADMIRAQSETATVEALFSVDSNERLREKIEAMGLTAGDELLIKRIIARTGKNKVLINGQMATLANLSAISELLINICGQHEHQVILNADNHIDILDEFGGCLAARSDYEETYNEHRQIRARIEKLEELRRRREEKIDLIKFHLKEITDAAPVPAEDAALADEKKVLINARKLTDCARRAYELLYGENSSVIAGLQEAQNQIKEIKKIDTGLNIAAAEIESSFFTLQETALALREYEKKLFFDPQRLDVIEERLETLARLKRKYGGSLESVLLKKQEMEEELQSTYDVEEELAREFKIDAGCLARMEEKARALSSLRKKAAAQLQVAVSTEMHALNMPQASFAVRFARSAEDGAAVCCAAKGCDEIEYYLAANVGEGFKPLSRIASGGELSRIVLALKNVLSHTGSVATVVFDEVDSGIGGATAEIVGRKLKEVAANHQVICITHLPQIASFGEAHYLVAKKVQSGRTVATVKKLDEKLRIEEISRMLGGVDVTAAAREHAREMMEGAHKQRRK
ncbi:MAG TPA: DNA repair protein RecN [Smithellaceae bacterium]|nr:DNA repair protein RecN [Smithellaceae bacterium]